MRPIESILIIEDNADVLRALALLLQALGAREVRSVDSAEGALALLETRSFAVIVTDYRLGGMDGVAFLETLRRRGDETPVVLLSGAPDRTGVIRAAQYPKVDFFGKPFPVAELVGAIEKLAA